MLLKKYLTKTNQAQRHEESHIENIRVFLCGLRVLCVRTIFYEFIKLEITGKTPGSACSLAGPALQWPSKLLYNQCRVSPAEAEGVGEGGFDIFSPCRVRNIVEIAIRAGMHEIGRRRDNALV